MKKIVLVFASLLTFSFQAYAQWQLQNPLPTPYNLNSGFFVSSDVGWMVGDYGTILKSTDGGLSWAKQNYNTNKNLTTVYFLSENIGFIGGDDILLRTNTAGNYWNEIDGNNGLTKGIIFINYVTGYLFGVSVGAGGHINRTTHQGTTWSYDILYPQIHQYMGSINSMTKTDSNNLWAVNTGGKILRSYDRGYDWHIIEDSSLIFSQNSIAAVNNDTFWIVGGDNGNPNRILKTTDGRQNFVVQLSDSLNCHPNCRQ